MPGFHDGPASPHFVPISFKGNSKITDLPGAGLSTEMASALEHFPRGACVAWGIPFEIGEVVVLKDQPVSIEIKPTLTRWFVFLHTSDIRPFTTGPGGIASPMRGRGQLGEHAADYVLRY